MNVRRPTPTGARARCVTTGVFTELISTVGVRDVQVDEVLSLDDDSLKALQCVLPGTRDASRDSRAPQSNS